MNRLTALNLLALLCLITPVFAQDVDMDGIPDHTDNCPAYWNATQKDYDGDGIGDWCDDTTIMLAVPENVEPGFKVRLNLPSREFLSASLNGDITRVMSKSDSTLETLTTFDWRSERFITGWIEADVSGQMTRLDLLLHIDFRPKDGYLPIQFDSVDPTGRWHVRKIGLGPEWMSNREPHPYYGDVGLLNYVVSPGMYDLILIDTDRDGDTELMVADRMADHFGIQMRPGFAKTPAFIDDVYSSPRINYPSADNHAIWKGGNYHLVDLNGDTIPEILDFSAMLHIGPEWDVKYQYIWSWLESKGYFLGDNITAQGQKYAMHYICNQGELCEDRSAFVYPDEWPMGYTYNSAFGDLNNDNLLDVVNFKDGSSVDVLINQGSAGTGFSNLFNVSRKQIYFASTEGLSLVYDTDMDGFGDIIVGGQISPDPTIPPTSNMVLAIIKNQGSGSFGTNHTVIDDYGPLLIGPRNIFVEDVDEDGNNEIIVYLTNGIGQNRAGIPDGAITSLVKIYSHMGPDDFTDVTEVFFENGDNEMDMFANSSSMIFLDVDYDGFKDLVPILGLEPSLPWFRGFWNDDPSFQYYHYNASTGKYQIRAVPELGPFGPYVTEYDPNLGHYNSFQPADLDGDGVYEWIKIGDRWQLTIWKDLSGFTSYGRPSPVISVGNGSYQAPIQLDFNASASTDPNGDALTFAWDFGDGATGSGETVSHTYTAAGEYTVVLMASDGALTGTDSLTVSIASGVNTESVELPESLVLRAAYPNPFNPTTTITYGLPAAAEVRITATDLLGRQVATLVAGDIKAAGYHTVQFNADGLASGTYLIRMEVGDFVATQQVVLLK